MWRRLNREDLEASNPLVSSSHALFLPFAWSVYDGYGLVDQENKEERYLQASEGASIRRRYEPLTEAPHLFLEFARLFEAKDASGAMREWIGRRGLLGLHENSERGGAKEALTSVWEETYKANALLTLYEAALSGDVEKLKQALAPNSDSPAVLPFLRDELELIDPDQPPDGDEPRGTQEGQDQTQMTATISGIYWVQLDNLSLADINTIDGLIETAMRIVIVEVQSTLASLVKPCFGTLAPLTGGKPQGWWAPELLTRSWFPANLLGAMYLQFYWLMTSAGNLSRCKYCGRIISHAPPIPSSGKTRKPRNDKEFCDSRCRQNYHYHARVKLARRDEKEGDDHA